MEGLPDNPSVDNPAVENPSVDNPSVNKFVITTNAETTWPKIFILSCVGL